MICPKNIRTPIVRANKTSNDIIAGKGRILKFKCLLCGYICLKKYFMLKYFSFNKTDINNLQTSLTEQKVKTFGLKQKYFLKSVMIRSNPVLYNTLTQ